LAWVPDSVLLQLLMVYGPQLKELHIQNTRIKVRHPANKPECFKNVYQSVHAVQYVLIEESVAKLLGDPHLTSQLKQLTSLALVDCDILDDEVDLLVRFLWLHSVQAGKALESLSLRSNRHMSPASFQKLCQAPVSHRLDLSLCDIKNKGGQAIAHAFESGSGWRQKHNVILKELVLSGSYQLDEFGFRPLASVVPHCVQKWDLSYCDMNEHQTQELLNELKHQLEEIPTAVSGNHYAPPNTTITSCPLQELIVQGAKMNNPEACRAIQSILQTNRSLVKIRLDDPKYPQPLSIPNLQLIVEGLEHHYGLQEFALDLHSMRRQVQLSPSEEKCMEACTVRDSLDYYLILNRSGRNILQKDDDYGFDKEAWFSALLKARLSRRTDVLYWFVRNSVVQMF